MIYMFSEGEVKKAVLTRNRFGLISLSLGSFWVKVRDYNKCGKGSSALKNEKGTIVIAPKKDNVVVVYKGNDEEITHGGFAFMNLTVGDKFSINGKVFQVKANLDIEAVEE